MSWEIDPLVFDFAVTLLLRPHHTACNLRFFRYIARFPASPGMDASRWHNACAKGGFALGAASKFPRNISAFEDFN
ncbi:MAG: hypothetical protein HRT63_11095 [Erythrobacter sp.]|nr:hypothetical protein [Erythrobacter sp.]